MQLLCNNMVIPKFVIFVVKNVEKYAVSVIYRFACSLFEYWISSATGRESVKFTTNLKKEICCFLFAELTAVQTIGKVEEGIEGIAIYIFWVSKNVMRKVPIVAATFGTFSITFLEPKNLNGCLLFPLIPSLVQTIWTAVKSYEISEKNITINMLFLLDSRRNLSDARYYSQYFDPSDSLYAWIYW
jgi:hypothetical protein